METPRLQILPPDPEFALIRVDFLLRNREFLKPWTPGRPPEFFTLESQAEYLRNKANLCQLEKEYRFYLFRKDQPSILTPGYLPLRPLIGDFGFTNIVYGAFWSCNLGYQMDQAFTRQGLMEEALREGIRWLFEEKKMHRIEANLMPENAPSRRLVEKLGFEYVGRSRNYLRINGKWEDHLHFALLNGTSP